jgi:hypothetical protein
MSLLNSKEEEAEIDSSVRSHSSQFVLSYAKIESVKLDKLEKMNPMEDLSSSEEGAATNSIKDFNETLGLSEKMNWKALLDM